jgi:esterase/lipase
MESKLAESCEVIKETDPRLTFKKPSKKTVLLCSNGFQNSDTHDATVMKDYFEKNFAKDYPECEIVPVQLFLPANKKTHHYRKFEKALEAKIEEYIAKDYDIILMGYSFSGALNAKMQHKYRKFIHKLILVAPVYDTILNGMIPGYIHYAVKFQKLVHKYGKQIANAMGRKTTHGMASLLVSILNSLLTCRRYYHKVTCETLILWGDQDELCTRHSMKKVQKAMKNPHVLYLYPKMTHGILKTVKQNGIVYEDILHYAFDTPFLLEKNSQIIAKATQQANPVKLDEDGEPIPTFNEIFTSLDPDSEEETARDRESL